MNNVLEIFADFTNDECYSVLNEIEKLRTESDIEIKWRAFQGENIQLPSTKSAHILAKWADVNNIGHDYRKIVYYNYFVLKKDISQNEVLEEIIDKLGFDEVKIEEVVSDSKYNEQLKEDLKKADELEIKNVPVIILNGTIVSDIKSVLLKKKVLN